MRNKIYIAIALCLTLWMTACRDADREMFSDSRSGVYFKLENLAEDTTLVVRQDTVVYTFAYESEEVQEREVCLPVELVGLAADRERKYRIEVLPAANTVEGIDYQTINLEQVFAAGKTVDSLRVVWNRDTSMARVAKRLDIRILGGDDFGLGVKEYTYVSLQVSDILEEPDWWEAWSSALGDYHPTKLREWYKIYGMNPLPEITSAWEISFMMYPQECAAIMQLKELFDNEEFYDEEGNRLYIPANL